MIFNTPIRLNCRRRLPVYVWRLHHKALPIKQLTVDEVGVARFDKKHTEMPLGFEVGDKLRRTILKVKL